MVTSTFAHPYALQVLLLWVSFVPVAIMGVLMFFARTTGDRSIRGPLIATDRIRVPAQPQKR